MLGTLHPAKAFLFDMLHNPSWIRLDCLEAETVLNHHHAQSSQTEVLPFSAATCSTSKSAREPSVVSFRTVQHDAEATSL